jgi:hypothetical protein
MKDEGRSMREVAESALGYVGLGAVVERGTVSA